MRYKRRYKKNLESKLAEYLDNEHLESFLKQKGETKNIDFPLCLLIPPVSVTVKLDNILCYGLISEVNAILTALMGYSLFDLPDIDDKVAGKYYPYITIIRKWLKYRYEDISYHSRPKYLSNLIYQYKRIKAYVDNYEEIYGKDSIACVHAQYIYQVMHYDGFDYPTNYNYNDFAVLSAITSKIGKTAYYKSITLMEIMLRSRGYKSMAVYNKYDGKPIENSEYHRVRRIVIKLSNMNFFTHLTYRKRITFYSTRLSIDELAKAILNAKTPKQEREAKRKRLEYEISRRRY